MKRSADIPLIVLMGVVLCTAVLGGIAVSGYLWYQSRQEPEVAYSGPCDPRIPFTTFTDSGWGYSISYPETWFIESYDPGVNPAFSVAPDDAKLEELPFFMAAIATTEGNFAPDFSERDDEVARVFLVRTPLMETPYQDFIAGLQRDSDEYNLGVTYEGAPTLINDLSGFVIVATEDGAIDRFVFLNRFDFTYEIRGYPHEKSLQGACLSVVQRIQESFTLNNP